MRNSAWYYKIWLKKLSKLPLKEDAGSAWAGMKDMLDAQMPVSHGGSGGSGTAATTKPFVAKLASLLGYALPVAAAIGVTTYIVMPIVIKPKEVVIKKERQSHLSIDTINSKAVQVFPDSLKSTDTLRNSVLSISDLPVSRAEVQGEIHRADHRSASLNTSVISKGKSDIDSPVNVNGQSGNRREILYVNEALAKENAGLTKENTGLAKENAGLTKENTGLAVNRKVSDEQKNSNLTTNDKAAGQKIKDHAGENSIDDKNKASKVAVSKKRKLSGSPKIKEIMTTPDYDFGLESGWNAGKNSSFYVGAFGSYAFGTRLLLNMGIRLNTSTVFSGSYITKPSHILWDSLSNYKVADRRKVMILNVPLTFEYRLSNTISVNAGPVISFPLSQSNATIHSELNKAQLPSTQYLDSARHSGVDSTLSYTKVNKVNLGITGGISVRFNQFYIEGKYLRNLSPYKFSNTLGGYEQYYGSFQLGLRYKFRK